MTRSNKPRKETWYKRWPNQPCIKFDLVTLQGSRISGVMALSNEKAEAVLEILFPKGGPKKP